MTYDEQKAADAARNAAAQGKSYDTQKAEDAARVAASQGGDRHTNFGFVKKIAETDEDFHDRIAAKLKAAEPEAMKGKSLDETSPFFKSGTFREGGTATPKAEKVTLSSPVKTTHVPTEAPQIKMAVCVEVDGVSTAYWAQVNGVLLEAI